MTEQAQTIKKVIESLLSKLTIDAAVDIEETTDGLRFVIKTQEGGLLIGENGKNLISLNHVIKKIARKKLDADVVNNKDFFSFLIDINDYQSKKIEELKDLARLNAQRVRYFKKEVVLKSMTSFERRIVHTALTDSPDIITESVGNEPDRQVVIKPYV